ncbi:hypothetical protein ACQP2P_20950 [Dactylosporangium sp. CA-139114]|uniref:hypothetical protein n=1 Tax=Dactylosporangium sp. CA-139114 TaxID=3239931 RepID=UPI003D95FD2C
MLSYFGGDTLDEFLLPATWLTPAALASPAPVALPDVDGCFLDDDRRRRRTTSAASSRPSPTPAES